jgi:dynein heavy chain
MRHFIILFDDLPFEAQTMPVAIQLRQNMKDFQNSVPMFEALKNDALRERHWQQLMEKTGKQFDVAPENFTLQSLFAMELHKHKEESAAIVLHATRELVIEQLLANIRQSWRGKEFTLVPHVRLGVDVGFLLGPVTEICQLQADHISSLKQIFSSP